MEAGGGIYTALSAGTAAEQGKPNPPVPGRLTTLPRQEKRMLTAQQGVAPLADLLTSAT